MLVWFVFFFLDVVLFELKINDYLFFQKSNRKSETQKEKRKYVKKMIRKLEKLKLKTEKEIDKLPANKKKRRKRK